MATTLAKNETAVLKLYSSMLWFGYLVEPRATIDLLPVGA